MRKLLLSICLLAVGALYVNAQHAARIHGISGSTEIQTIKTSETEQVYFQGFEGFDATSATTAAALPAGWEVYRTATLATAPTTVATTKRWSCNNSVSNPFGEAGGSEWQGYVKTGLGSMIIGYTAEDFTWAVSSSITLPDVTGLELEFWMWYTKTGSSGTYPTNFHLQVFADGTWHAVKSWVGEDNNNWASALTFSLDAYKGKDIKLGFVYEYTDGYQMAIDDIKITKPAPVKYPITFTVIDQKEIYTNIKIKGDMTNWATVAMTQDPTHTWKVTLDVVAGTYGWGAIEDDGTEWGQWLIEGANRSFTVAADGTVTGQTDYTILAPGDIAVTFQVNIKALIDAGTFNPANDFIDIAGSFNGWGGSDILDPDENNPNIYVFTTEATFRDGQELVFKFRKNGVWNPTTELPTSGAETPDDPNGKLNRKYVVVKDIDNIYNAVWGENYSRNIGEVEVLSDISVAIGATVASLNLPETLAVKLGVPGNLTNVTVNLPVTWNTENFNSAQNGETVLTGTIGLEVEDTSKEGETKIVYFQGFEGFDATSATTAAALPAGWEVYRTATLATAPSTVATTKRWSCNNSVSNPFGEAGGSEWQGYVKTGLGSMIIGYTAEEFTWAVTSSITLPDVTGIDLEFWMWYTKTGSSGTYPTNFHLQVFADGTWHAVKSWVGEDNNNWASALTFNLDAYKGKSIKLGFVYEYTDGYQMAIDDIKITAPKSYIKYFNGYELSAQVKVIVGSTNVTTNPTFKFNMYPNPTTTYLNIVGVEQISTIRVINIIGQQVMNISNVGTDSFEMNTSDLNNGIYIITVTGKNGKSFSSRFVKR